MNPRFLKPHPLAELMPAMSADEFTALTADIKRHGVREPVVVFENMILDGRHRLKACDELCIDPPSRVFEGTAEEAKAFVLSANVHRRHLTLGQRKALVVDELQRDPEQSNRQIAATARVDDKTVAAARAKLEHGAEIPHHETRTGKDGVKQPATKPTKPKAAPTKPRRPPTTKAAPVVSLTELIDGYRTRISHDHQKLPDGQKQEFVRRLAAIIKMLTPEVAAPSADTITAAAAAAVVLQ